MMMAPRTLEVIEVRGLTPAMGASRLLISAGLLSRLSARDGRQPGEVFQVSTVELLSALKHGETEKLDDQHTLGNLDGIQFVAGRDDRGVLFLQTQEELPMSVAGCVLGVVAEIKIDRAAVIRDLQYEPEVLQ